MNPIATEFSEKKADIVGCGVWGVGCGVWAVGACMRACMREHLLAQEAKRTFCLLSEFCMRQLQGRESTRPTPPSKAQLP